jgi:glutathione S-transferase
MMPDLTLYSFKLCPFAHRVRIALAEKQLEAKVIEVDLKNKSPAFLAISPTGRVPLLLHGDTRIWESSIILEYLDDAFPQISLMPKNPEGRAKARLLIDFANTNLYAPTHRLIFTRDDTLRTQLEAEMARSVLELERQLLAERNEPYVLGDATTLADIALYPWFEQVATLERFSTFKMPAEAKAVRTWQASMANRPAVQACARTDDFYADGYQRYLAA